MSSDFMASRLPPFGHKPSEDSVEDSDMESEEEEKAPKDQKSPKKKTTTPAKRKSKGGDTEEEEEDEDANPTEEVPCTAIIHSLNNERDLHMTGSPDDMEPSSLKLPVHFARAATALLNAKDFVRIKDIDLE